METDKTLNNATENGELPAGPDDYRVGYGKPPKDTQFKKGESGNRKGRPKGIKNLKTDFLEEMQEKIAVREGDRRFTVTKRRAILKSLTNLAVRGNVRAAAKAMDLDAQLNPELEPDRSDAPVSGDEEQLLELLNENALRRKAANQEKDPSPAQEPSES